MENSNNSVSAVDANACAAVVEDDSQRERQIGLLTSGLVNMCERDLNRVQNCLKEVLMKQDKLGADLSQLNQEHSTESRAECQQMFSNVKEYTDRLHVIKKQMTGIHQRVKQLKKRAIALKNFVARETNAIRQRQMNEEALIAKSTAPTQNK